MTAPQTDTKVSSDSASDWSDVMEDQMRARSAVCSTTGDRVERARQLFERARSERFAVLAFNAENQDTVLAIARAAAAQRAPVLVAVNHEEVAAIGLANLRAMIDNYNDELGTEIYLNLDRSPTAAAAKSGIDAGFELVHIDLCHTRPSATDEEVVHAAREVVGHARTTGAMIESGPNYLGAAATVFDDAIDYAAVRRTYTTPRDAASFVAATGIDAFAATVSNLHAGDATPESLDLGLLGRVRDALDISMSLHSGDSGIPGHLFTEAAQLGVSKVNLHTELRHPYRAALELQLRMHLEQDAMVRLMPTVIAAVQRAAEEHIARFGATGRAAA